MDNAMLIFGHYIPYIIAGAMIGVLGAFISSIITLLVYHIPFFVNIRVKAEVKQKMKAENFYELLNLLREFQVEISDTKDTIELLSSMIVRRYRGKEIDENIGFGEVDEIVKKLNLCAEQDLDKMLVIANNGLKKHYNKRLIISLGKILILFKADAILFGNNAALDQIYDELEKIVNELSRVFSTMKSFERGKIEKLEEIKIKYQIEREGKKFDFAEEIGKLILGGQNIFAKRLD